LDVRMVETRKRERLAPEPPQQGYVRGTRCKNLDRNVALELFVAGAIDHSHPAFADTLENSIGADAAADHGDSVRGLGYSRTNCERRSSFPGGSEARPVERVRAAPRLAPLRQHRGTRLLDRLARRVRTGSTRGVERGHPLGAGLIADRPAAADHGASAGHVERAAHSGQALARPGVAP